MKRYLLVFAGMDAAGAKLVRDAIREMNAGILGYAANLDRLAIGVCLEVGSIFPLAFEFHRSVAVVAIGAPVDITLIEFRYGKEIAEVARAYNAQFHEEIERAVTLRHEAEE